MDKFTEGMLSRLDKDVKKKFGLSLIDVLEDPASYLSEKGFAVKLSKINDYVDQETERMLEQSKATTRSFHESIAKADNLTRRVGSYISAHARQNNIPMVKPASVELSMFRKSKFYISEIDDDTTKFLEKLIESSSFVVDMTKSYDNLKLGAWLFSGDKEYAVSIELPKNSVLLTRIARVDLLQQLKEASESIKGL